MSGTDNNADPLASRLRLFLSVDMVGSTAFKQANQSTPDPDGGKDTDVNGGQPWFSPIAQFYREIERLFAKEWDYYSAVTAPKFDWPTGEPPQLWKSAGDELLYTKVLADHREAFACLSCWIKAIREYRGTLRSKYQNLDLKSAVWLAGFPINNTEVIFRSSVGDLLPSYDDDDPLYSNLFLLHEFYKNPSNRTLTRDFIGPSIDTGFRLCGLATSRKLIVSVDLMLMIIHAVRGSPHNLGLIELSFHYDGRIPLKGVFSGADYPVFWIDMSASAELERIEDKLLDKRAKNTDEIKEFCESFFAENKRKLFVPYITGNQDAYFATPPRHHQERLRRLRAFWTNEHNRRLDEANSSKEAQAGQEPDEKSVDELVRRFHAILGKEGS